MEIDLREIQALHARYAREPVVIDLEAQVRSRPAPLLLAHEPKRYTSPWRRAWNARGQVGRGSLMVVGGSVLCAALGMGAARLFAALHPTARAEAAHATAPQPVVSAPASAVVAGSASGTPARALTSQDLGTAPARSTGLANVDPGVLLRSAQPASAQPRVTQEPATAAEQTAIASPIRQRASGVAQPDQASAAPAINATPVAAPTVAPTPVPPSTAVTPEQQEGHPVHRVVHHHVAPVQQDQATANNASKPATPAPRTGDVQLF